MRGPGLGPKAAGRGSEKSHLLGASPCSSKRKGEAFYGWKNGGIFALVGTGGRGLRVCLQVGQWLAHRAQVSDPREEEGRLSRDAGVLPGSRDGVGTHRATQDAWPLERPLENPPPRPPVPKSVLRTLCGAGSAAGKCGPGEIERSSGWQGGLPLPRQVPRVPVKMV